MEANSLIEPRTTHFPCVVILVIDVWVKELSAGRLVEGAETNRGKPLWRVRQFPK